MEIKQGHPRVCRYRHEIQPKVISVPLLALQPRIVVAFCGVLLAMLLYMNGCTPNTVGAGTSDEVVGRIITSDSVAVGGLQVALRRYSEATQSFVDTIPVITDPEGHFAFRNLAGGRYLLDAMGAGGLSVMKEVVVSEGRDTSLGTLVADTFGSLQWFIRKPTDTTVSADTRVHIYKGEILIAKRWVPGTDSIDSLPPGNFRVWLEGQITYFYNKDQETKTLFDADITVLPCSTAYVDPVDINEAVIRTDDTAVVAEIRAVKDFLVRAGCDPFISAGWLHSETGHLRIIEAASTNGMSLDSAANAIAAFPGIEKIRLSGFGGTVLPDTLFTFNRLTELSLTNGEISGVSERISALSRLSILRLNHNAITQIPEVVLNRTLPLQRADFTGNPLRNIGWEQQDIINSLLDIGIQIILAGKPCAINERDYRALLSFFKHNGLDDRIVHQYVTTGTGINEPDVVIGLDMNDVTISGFPSDFGNLEGLRDLYIIRNLIDTLPQVLGGLTSLETLHITNGTITGLPLQLGRCTHLQAIDFSNNRITRLPKWLSTLRSLKYADFSINRIDTYNTIVPPFCVIEQQYNDSILPAPDSLFVEDTATVSAIVKYGHSSDSLPLMNYIQCCNNRVILLRLVVDNNIRLAAIDSLCAMAATLDSLKTLHIVMRNGAEVLPALSTIFPNLEGFIATGGALRSLPASFATSFPALKRIALPGNRFEVIPLMLRSLASLVDVDLYYNRLTNLTVDDSSWLDRVSTADRRVLWDTGFGFSYVQGMTWQESQLDRYLPGTDR